MLPKRMKNIGIRENGNQYVIVLSISVITI